MKTCILLDKKLNTTNKESQNTFYFEEKRINLNLLNTKKYNKTILTKVASTAQSFWGGEEGGGRQGEGKEGGGQGGGRCCFP